MTAPLEEPIAGPPYQVVIMAKAPVPGQVKTRLCPPLTPDQAAAVAEAALLDSIAAVEASSARSAVVALEGPRGTWLSPRTLVLTQRDGPFGRRLAGAIDDAWAGSARPVLVIGMDTPQLRGADLDAAARPLLRGDGPVQAVLGPAEDGGYWCIGVRRPIPGLFDGVPMSTAHTCRDQRARLAELEVTYQLLPEQRDVDEIDDALAVAGLVPGSHFARCLRAVLTPTPALRPWSGLAPPVGDRRAWA
jgi:rSAM/selenodomain-associated transferase 1